MIHQKIDWEKHQMDFYKLHWKLKLKYVWLSLVNSNKVKRINAMYAVGKSLENAIKQCK